MTLRRTLFASPLAVLVAVFAHFVAFGFEHAPGAERSPELFGTLGAALALGMLLAFGAGLLGLDDEPGARTLPAWFAPLLLAAAGTASFSCIELSEGHLALRTLLGVAAVSIPLAYAVAFVARSARAAVRAAGASYGDFVCRALSRASRAIARVARVGYARSARSFFVTRFRRGRAPPALI